MAKLNLPLLPLILSLLFIAARAAESTAAPSNFIKASCSATTYPALCVQSLSMYATAIQKSPRQLAQTALSVSLDRAQTTKTFITKLTKFKGLKTREYEAIKDCLEEISDTVDRLSQSIRELKHTGKAGGPDFQWRMSNVETWVSAALTDDSTCMDGFAGKALNGRIKTSVRARVTHVAQVTSPASAGNFIDASCKATLYPAFCVQSLSVHAAKIQENPYQLANVALSESLARAQSTKAFLSKLNGKQAKKGGALKDCLGQS
ncbi:hypothetical protein F0562_026499 [Nyssa sinensis]|uniref:Pectinesterase inhibitor domain-containing protein n=1 Tax=Nyssa sinensis TaxID=561372 RepID=A0A5J5BDJ2_9ASTE|nr:hypothetical protein F0562_026499 [Nyssa sinensis]